MGLRRLATQLRAWARRLAAEVVTLWFCARHPATPLAAKVLAAAVAAYAFSPIDLIPDFIPVLGLLDDLVLLPVGVWLALKLVPAAVIAECREEAERWLAAQSSRPRSGWGAAMVVAAWLAVAGLAWYWLAA